MTTTKLMTKSARCVGRGRSLAGGALARRPAAAPAAAAAAAGDGQPGRGDVQPRRATWTRRSRAARPATRGCFSILGRSAEQRAAREARADGEGRGVRRVPRQDGVRLRRLHDVPRAVSWSGASPPRRESGGADGGGPAREGAPHARRRRSHGRDHRHPPDGRRVRWRRRSRGSACSSPCSRCSSCPRSRCALAVRASARRRRQRPRAPHVAGVLFRPGAPSTRPATPGCSRGKGGALELGIDDLAQRLLPCGHRGRAAARRARRCARGDDVATLSGGGREVRIARADRRASSPA